MHGSLPQREGRVVRGDRLRQLAVCHVPRVEAHRQRVLACAAEVARGALRSVDVPITACARSGRADGSTEPVAFREPAAPPQTRAPPQCRSWHSESFLVPQGETPASLEQSLSILVQAEKLAPDRQRVARHVTPRACDVLDNEGQAQRRKNISDERDLPLDPRRRPHTRRGRVALAMWRGPDHSRLQPAYQVAKLAKIQSVAQNK